MDAAPPAFRSTAAHGSNRPGARLDGNLGLFRPAKAAPAEHYTRHIWRIQDGLPEDTVQSIEQSGDGYLWIGTTGGLVHFKDGVFRAYSEATGLTNSFVRSLMEDDQGRIWIGTDNGLFQMIQANSGR